MQSQMYVPPLTRINKLIISVYAGLFVLTTILKMSAGIHLVGILGLSPSSVMSGAIWQLITFPFVDTQFMTVLFNGLILWFIGSELESKWGEKFYLKFISLSMYIPGLVYLIFSLLIGRQMGVTSFYGLNGMNLALLVAYGIIYSERVMLFMFIFPMKAKYFCMLLAVIELFMALSSNASVAAWMHLLSMVFAFVYLKYISFKARGGSVSSVMAQRERNKVKNKLTLIKNEPKEDKPNSDDPKFWQ